MNKKRGRPRPPLLIAEPLLDHRPRQKRHHVAIEYRDKDDLGSATSLIRNLRPWAKWAVLGNASEAV